MSTILEALAVIKGKDATGGAFDAVANKIGRLARAANALNRDVQKQMNLARVAEAQGQRMQRSTATITHGAKMAVDGAIAAGASHAVAAAAREAVRVAADRQHEKVRMSASGMTAKDIAEAGEAAGAISKKYPSLSQTEIMHTARNVRSMVGDMHEALQVLEPLAKLRVVALGAHPEKAAELNESFDKLAKGMEIKGVTQDLEKFNHYIDGMAKALNVFGDTLRPTDYYEMFKYGRAATNALSDDFMLKTAPTLAQELGGSSAGKALSSFYTQFVGGKMSNKALEQAVKYGLITDESKIIKTSTGNVKGVLPGAFAGQEYLQPGKTDPYGWVNNILLPALAQKGVTDPGQIQEVIAALASQQTTAQMMAIFATQQKRIVKDAELVHGANGIEAADKFQKDDPKVIAKSVHSQFDNLLSNTSEGIMPATNAGMNWLASGLSWAAEHAKEKPGHIAAGGAWGASLASALSIDAGLSMLSRWKGGAGSLFATKTMASLAPMLAVTQLASDSVTDDDLARLKQYEAGPRSRIYQLDALGVNGWGPRRDASGRMINPGMLDRWIWPENDGRAETRARLEKELEGFGYNAGVKGGRYGGQGGPNWTIEDIRSATGIGGAGGEVKAIVEGQATLEANVTVKPSSEFWATVESKINNAINAFRSTGGPSSGTSGSTGRSMPEAGAPQ